MTAVGATDFLAALGGLPRRLAEIEAKVSTGSSEAVPLLSSSSGSLIALLNLLRCG
jgi:hypothetical protein